MKKSLVTLWKFSRPHTVIGSMISVLTLYIILSGSEGSHHLPVLFMSLAIGICTNLFIVGINQIADVNIDKINKPWLPIAAGELPVGNAKIIVGVALLIGLSISLYLTPYLFVIIALSMFIGWAYSMPPLHLKKHHISAAIAISSVRGILVNAGAFITINKLVNPALVITQDFMVLSLFIIVFSIVISWFKDLPDMEGDAQYDIKTLAILYSPKVAFLAGNLLVIGAYLLTIGLKYKESLIHPSPQTTILLHGHIVLLSLFLANAFSIRLYNHSSIKSFYKRFWLFFFAEYLLYLLAYL